MWFGKKIEELLGKGGQNKEKVEFKKGNEFVVCQPIDKNVDEIH